MESFEFTKAYGGFPLTPKRLHSYGPLKFDPKNGGKLSLTFEDLR